MSSPLGGQCPTVTELRTRRGVPSVEAIAGTETDTATPVRSSRETPSAVAHGGNPQDRAASPRDWLNFALFTFDF
ncbi:hypothetical protein LC593_16020 [Nostoc sp. CHAB 5844]|nr:hypothetical protein [Nostoc sp. CHAB 5844]